MKFSKILKLFAVSALVIASLLALASCEGGFVVGDFDFNDIDDHNPQYENQTYTVTFDTLGGSEIASQSVARGKKATAPAEPTKLGYVFRGWYANGIRWDFDGYAIRSDMTLTAKWVASGNTYTVSFDTRGAAAIHSQTVNEGALALLPSEPVLEEHYFGGWYCGDTEWDFDTQISEDVSLWAKWIPYTYYTVTFNSNGGSEVESQSILAGECAELPTKPVLEGNRLLGWYVGSIKWDFTTPIESDMTLTAKWKERPENLIYDVDTVGLRIVISPETKGAVRDFAFDNLLYAIEEYVDSSVGWTYYEQQTEVEHEIVICETTIEGVKRQVSVDAYAALDAIEREADEVAFLIYSNGSSVAIAFDDVADSSVAIRALQYFIDNYVGEELALAPGVVYYEKYVYEPSAS